MNKQNRKLQGTESQRISTFSVAAATGKKKKTAGTFLAFSSQLKRVKTLPLATGGFPLVCSQKGFSNYTKCEFQEAGNDEVLSFRPHYFRAAESSAWIKLSSFPREEGSDLQ